MNKFSVALIACVACIDWTRFSGTVKSVNLKAATVTIQLKGGDIITIPVDYQVVLTNKDHEVLRGLKSVSLDDKITLTRTEAAPPPAEDMTGMAQPENATHTAR
jgi:hypothetical protein